jgi:hypothetical protein
MSRYHMLAGLPDSAEELRSLAVVEAGSGADALRLCLREPEMYFIVTAVEAEEHFVRDYDGEVRDATEVARRHSRIRSALDVDAL